jgi:hypothetical protein
MGEDPPGHGPKFEPYFPVVMPPLINAAATKADIPVYAKSDIECTEISLTNIHRRGQREHLGT